MKVYIDIVDKRYLKESLTFCGIINPINCEFTVFPYGVQSQIPFMTIKEGTIFTHQTMFRILQEDNIIVVVNDETVFRKQRNMGECIVINDPIDHFDMYQEDEKKMLDKLLLKFEPENNDMVYYSNTEEYKSLSGKFDKIVGVASGDMVARWAYESKITNVEYYDYSYLSLKFQKKLINSNDIREVYYDYLPILNTGQRKATMEDLRDLDFDRMQVYYDYLKNCEVEYGVCDIRDPNQLRSLLTYCDRKTALWLSNIYYYASSLSTDKQLIFSMLDQSPATILPYTRVNYEG